MIPFPYHCGNVRISYQSKENVEDAVHNDVDGSDYCSDDFDNDIDDFDEYLVLSLTRRYQLMFVLLLQKAGQPLTSSNK
jgi:hypothetical protein